MSKILNKIIIISTLFIIFFNVSFPIISRAEDYKDDLKQQFDDAGVEQLWESARNYGAIAIDGVAGILTYSLKITCAAIAIPVQLITTQLCGLDAGVFLTSEDIIFTGSSRKGQVKILDINFFDIDDDTNNSMMIFRKNVAKWYFNIRTIAIVLSLAVLIYIGIRMAISSVASDKAMYKKMLIDWLVGFLVLVFLHYFIIVVVNLNNQLVDLVYSLKEDTNVSIMQDYNGALIANIFSPSFVTGWGSLLLYIILIGTTVALFIMYMKRLFTVGFLIVISPLITVTYSMDKLGDGKSQALGTWMKEFLYNVLIQPFHCIIYMVFVSASITTLKDVPSLGNLLFSILSVLFIFKAEDIIKKIFGFANASSMEGMVAAGALAANGINKMIGGATKTAKAASNASGSASSKSAGIQRKQIPSTASKAASNAAETASKGAQNIANGLESNASLNLEDKGEEKRKSAFSRALSEFVDETKGSINEFFADPKEGLENLAKDALPRIVKAHTQLPLKLLAGGVVAGATGNGFNGIITGVAVRGGKFTRKINNLADQEINERAMERQERKLAAAYEKYRIANNTLSDEELYNNSADLLEADINTIADPIEANYAKQLQKMQDLYLAVGRKDPEARVMSKVEDIQVGNVKNSIKIKLDSVENAAKQYKASQSSAGITDDQIINMSKTIMADMDKVKAEGEKYLRSDNYKELSKDEKTLAKEIFKSKEVLSAIGDDNIKSSNKEIELAIKRGLED